MITVAIMDNAKSYLICPICGDLHILINSNENFKCDISNITFKDPKLIITDHTIMLENASKYTLKELRQFYLCKLRNIRSKVTHLDNNSEELRQLYIEHRKGVK